MYISNARRTNNEDWDFDIKASNNEVEYLVNLAVGVLIVNGQLALQEKDEEQVVSIHRNEGMN